MYIGLHERDITPPLGCNMPGYYCERLADGVLDNLYCKAVVFKDSGLVLASENSAAMIVIDAVGFDRSVCEKVAERVSRFTKIPKENISVIATHTHLGIPTGEPISKMEEDYMESLICYASDTAICANNKAKKCDIYFGMGKAEGLCFNRDYVLEDGSICTNPARTLKLVKSYSGVNDFVPVVSFKDETGKVIGALIEYACHQDCVGGLKYSGDYSSIMSYELKKAYGKDFVSVYVPGACGDINNIDFIGGNTPNYRYMGEKLAAEAKKTIEESIKIEDAPIKVKSDFAEITIRRATKEQKEYAEKVMSGEISEVDQRVMLNKRILELLLEFEESMKNKAATDILPCKVINIGKLLIFNLPGELYHQFEDTVREKFRDYCVLFSELAGGDAGYFPVKELFGTFVYPTQLCRGSHFVPEGGYILTQKAIEAAESIL